MKYRDPDDPQKAWTGIGVPPTWLREELGKGRALEDFLL
ncbi:MAG TPA: H-NS family nucleoid-associated regulatory protein [Gammaproteobacteria bacterium]|nr:H-NS family nucleoid-associated regulatory protein [Gammaproteobacteria bacterium]